MTNLPGEGIGIARAHQSEPLTFDEFFRGQGGFNQVYRVQEVCDEPVHDVLPARTSGIVSKSNPNSIGLYTMHIATMLPPFVEKSGMPASRTIVIHEGMAAVEIGDSEELVIE